MLVIATYRPELTPPWPQRSHMIPITLNRLERPEVEAMVGHLAGGRPLPSEVVDHIVALTMCSSRTRCDTPPSSAEVHFPAVLVICRKALSPETASAHP
jgi:hypothetical protein